jgi:hypothetical protein
MLTSGAVCRSSKARTLDLGEGDAGGLAQGRQDRAIELVGGRRQLWKWLHGEGVVGLREPLAAALEDSLRAGFGEHPQLVEIGVRLAAEGHALGQDVRAAAKAAEPLHAAHEIGQDASPGGGQLLGAGAGLEQRGEHRVHLGLGSPRVDAGLDGDDVLPDKGRDLGGQLLVEDQPAVEPAALGAAQHAGQQVEVDRLALAPGR